jgi:hypothetical protein
MLHNTFFCLPSNEIYYYICIGLRHKQYIKAIKNLL